MEDPRKLREMAQEYRRAAQAYEQACPSRLLGMAIVLEDLANAIEEAGRAGFRVRAADDPLN